MSNVKYTGRCLVSREGATCTQHTRYQALPRAGAGFVLGSPERASGKGTKAFTGAVTCVYS
jgi:hypothetical protein